jgi:hypothetical protein
MKSQPAVLAVLCLTAACSAKDGGNGSAAVAAARHPPYTAPTKGPASVTDSKRETVYTSAVREGIWYQAGRHRVRSLVPDAAIVSIGDLPVIPYEKPEKDFCGRDNAASGAEARWASSRGWRINLETTLGPIRLINVFRRYEPVNAICYQIDARIILFEHGVPIATILSGVMGEGPIEVLEDTDHGGFRLENEVGDPPFGELFLTGRDIEIRPLPPADRICGDTLLPNVFGKRIGRARRILRGSGWKSEPQPPPARYRDVDGNLSIENYTDDGLYKKGFKERSDCNPMGFCDFNYRRGKVAIKLHTYDETVTRYYETCPHRAAPGARRS